MKFELTKWNKDKLAKVLGDLTGKSIMTDEIHLKGVDSIKIEEQIRYDGDPDESIGYDGGKVDYIEIVFHIGDGEVSFGFCPDAEICHFWHELDDLICFKIEGIKEYVENTKYGLDHRLQEYEKYMSR